MQAKRNDGQVLSEVLMAMTRKEMLRNALETLEREICEKQGKSLFKL